MTPEQYNTLKTKALTPAQGARLGMAFKIASDQNGYMTGRMGEKDTHNDKRDQFLKEVLAIYDLVCEAEVRILKRNAEPFGVTHG